MDDNKLTELISVLTHNRKVISKVIKSMQDLEVENIYVLSSLERETIVPSNCDMPKIVCLCGSGRFKEAFENAEFDETLKGNVVLTIGCNTKDIARNMDWSYLKPMLDELHKRKIDLCDEILVLNVDGYVGESTKSEIEYAEKHNKNVRYLETVYKEK